MNEIRFAYLPLSFITSDEEIRRQVKNTIICRYIFDKFKNPQKLLKFLKSTQYGFTVSAQDAGKNKLLRISDIKNGAVDWETVPYCDCEREEDYLLQINDILIARTGGTTGKSFIVKEIFGKPVFASYLISLRVNEKLNPDYLYLFLNSYVYWSQIVQMKKGSAQPNLNAETLKELIIPYCDLKIQEKLVALAYNSFVGHEFNSLFEAINETLEKVDLANELKTEYDEENLLISKLRQAILQEAVQGKLVPQDPTDEPASELLKRIKAEKLQLMREKKVKKEKSLPLISPDEVSYELPEGWAWCRLGEIGQINPRNQAPDNIDAAFIPMSLISEKYGVIPRSAKKNWGDIKRGFTHFQENDVVLAKITPCFENSKAGIVKGLFNRIGAGTTELHVFRGDNEFILPECVYIYFKSPQFLREGQKKMTGTAGQKRVPADFVTHNPFPLPPLNEQKRIVAKVDELMRLCDELEEQIRQSKEESERLMQAVLQEAFEGKDVEESNAEVSVA